MVRACWLVLVIATSVLGGCRPNDAPKAAVQSVALTSIPPDHSHSTLADTNGLAHDLLIIERKLGPVDPGVRDHLTAVEVTYYSFADSACTVIDKRELRSGILLVHACIADDVKAIFERIREDTFPIAKVIPVNKYGLNADSTGWNDEASMADNNTSAFNYRAKSNTGTPSKHAHGIAIDINPMLNPMVHRGRGGWSIQPEGSRHDPRRVGTLSRTNTAEWLKGLGWSWGGRWPNPHDYQHIEKTQGRCAHLRFHLQ